MNYKMLRKSSRLSKCINSLIRKPRFNLNLHEYQAAELLESYSLPVLMGKAFNSPDAIKDFSQSLIDKSGGAVLKAQVHAGGRGRGHFKNSKLQGGVFVLEDAREVHEKALNMLNDVLITKQTGETGKPCNTVYLVERVDVKQEIYLSIMLDRSQASPVFIMSPQGGMGIEEIDKKFILQKKINVFDGLTQADVSECVDFMEFETQDHKSEYAEILRNLYACFCNSDATLLEINPLVITQQGELLICDSKVNVDDNAHFRQNSLFEQEDLSQKDSKEVDAEKHDLNYVKLEGQVGCLVNGAGLAMATMDLINFKKGKPANFLDVGGGTDTDRVVHAIRIINEDPEVESILVNIFGGIVRCDIIASGVIEAVNKLNISKPICLCVKGTNSSQARQMIKDSGLNLFWFESVHEAADKAIQLTK